MRSAAKRYLVAVTSPDVKGVQLLPMLQWCRDNPDAAPADLDIRGKNSRAIRRALEVMGWSSVETESEVRLTPPGESAAIGAILEEAEESPPSDADEGDEPAAFALERQLQEFIAHNLERLLVGGRRLQLYAEGGASGLEYQTAVGRIDILAIDQDRNFVVFELKRARAPDRAIGQLARYMGWVKGHLAGASSVRGVIVARDIDRELRYALAAFPNVEIFEYKVNFTLHNVPPVTLASTP
ncbi:endonuclease NucS domain-containing protein [Caballeronia grimmiae]|uniref:endonuclease NucS domain-containing protein n=1 Tax=Caballeronia grimmiae TaxID=1071679 RepID=UPI0038BB7D7B